MREFGHLFSRIFTIGPADDTGLGPLHRGSWQPPADIYERDDALIVVVELPGVDKGDISVTAEQGVLSITGVRPKRIPEGTHRVHQLEIPHGQYCRVLRLPDDADLEHIEAEYKEGYLVIEIPRGSSG